MTLKAVGDIQTPPEHLQRAGVWPHLQTFTFITTHYLVRSATAAGPQEHPGPLGRPFLYKR